MAKDRYDRNKHEIKGSDQHSWRSPVWAALSLGEALNLNDDKADTPDQYIVGPLQWNELEIATRLAANPVKMPREH